MQKAQITLTGTAMIQLESGAHEVIFSEGDCYVKLFQGIPTLESSRETEEKTSVVATAKEVVDDTVVKPKAKNTKPSTKATAQTPAPAKVEVVDTDSRTPIPQESWAELTPDTMVYAKLQGVEGADADKLWEAKVVGYKAQKGMTDEQFVVHFIEDGQEDYLREGDELYEYSVQM